VERAEFTRFYEAGWLGLVIQQHVMAGDRVRAEAAVREAFVRAWLAWPAVRAMPDPMGWVRQMADRLRAPQRHRAGGTSSSGGTAGRLPGLALLDRLGQLPSVQRRMLVLR
jgi:hypothetical protein